MTSDLGYDYWATEIWEWHTIPRWHYRRWLLHQTWQRLPRDGVWGLDWQYQTDKERATEALGLITLEQSA